MNVTAVRTRLWDTFKDVSTLARAIGELARDLNAAFDGMPLLKLVSFQSLYTEPMFLSLNSNPVGIVALRIRQTNSQDTVIGCGCAVEWVWDSSRAKINHIDGMTVGSGNTYSFDFLAVG